MHNWIEMSSKQDPHTHRKQCENVNSKACVHQCVGDGRSVCPPTPKSTGESTFHQQNPYYRQGTIVHMLASWTCLLTDIHAKNIIFNTLEQSTEWNGKESFLYRRQRRVEKVAKLILARCKRCYMLRYMDYLPLPFQAILVFLSASGLPSIPSHRNRNTTLVCVLENLCGCVAPFPEQRKWGWETLKSKPSTASSADDYTYVNVYIHTTYVIVARATIPKIVLL